MKTEWNIQARAFPVTVRDQSTGQEREERIVLVKEQLQAAQIIGESSYEVIHRLCGRAGLTVLDIGAPERREISLNMEELFKFHGIAMADKRGAVL